MLSDGYDSGSEFDRLRRLENCICCARAELASDPLNTLLREFIDLNEVLARKQRTRLTARETVT